MGFWHLALHYVSLPHLVSSVYMVTCGPCNLSPQTNKKALHYNEITTFFLWIISFLFGSSEVCQLFCDKQIGVSQYIYCHYFHIKWNNFTFQFCYASLRFYSCICLQASLKSPYLQTWPPVELQPRLYCTCKFIHAVQFFESMFTPLCIPLDTVIRLWLSDTVKSSLTSCNERKETFTDQIGPDVWVQ